MRLKPYLNMLEIVYALVSGLMPIEKGIAFCYWSWI